MTKILLIGDEIVDHYVFTDPVKVSEEAPVLVVRKNDEAKRPGGAANVCKGLEAMGAIVTPFYGRKSPSVKMRVVVGAQQVLRLDDDNFKGPNLEGGERESLERMMEKADVIAISDYGKGVWTAEIREMVTEYPKKLVVDPYQMRVEYGPCALIKPNKLELESVVGFRILDADTLRTAAQMYMKQAGASTIVVTMGPDGAVLFDRERYWGQPFRCPTEATVLTDVTGAGDTMFAVLAYIWGQPNFSKSTAVRYATKAASIAVRHAGTYVVDRKEVFGK